MLVAIALGMGAANSPLSGVYDFIHHYPLRLGIAPVVIDAPQALRDVAADARVRLEAAVAGL